MANGPMRVEALCAPSPLRKQAKIEPEFNPFMTLPGNELKWSAIKKSLIDDGFSCSKYDEADRCERWVLSVHLNALKDIREEKFRGIYGDDLITPRILTVYEGKWFEPGPTRGPLCEFDKVTKKVTCPLKIPQRGTKEGICMVPEDWHAFYGVPLILNGITP
jgi:hypothetical protein